MRRDITRTLLILSVVAPLAPTPGCRVPEPDDMASDAGDFDAATDDDAGPGTACPSDAPDLFNNAYSPYMGGEESVDLEVIDFSYFS
jgi:hypothetical protein